METKLPNSEFLQASTTRKGAVGERILSRVAHSFFPGAISFVPVEDDGAHQCDRILIHWQDKRIVLVDAKAKPARTYYPDTGIDEGSFKIYREMGKRHRSLVLLAFIDEHRGCCYGNMLSILAKPRKVYWRGRSLAYPFRVPGKTGLVVCFPVDYMRKLADLQTDEIEELMHLSTREDFQINNEITQRIGIALAPGSWLPAQRSLRI